MIIYNVYDHTHIHSSVEHKIRNLHLLIYISSYKTIDLFQPNVYIMYTRINVHDVYAIIQERQEMFVNYLLNIDQQYETYFQLNGALISTLVFTEFMVYLKEQFSNRTILILTQFGYVIFDFSLLADSHEDIFEPSISARETCQKLSEYLPAKIRTVSFARRTSFSCSLEFTMSLV